MPESKIILPDDSTASGSHNMHSREQTIAGIGTVQDLYAIEISDRVIHNSFNVNIGVRVITLAAQAFPTCWWYLINPIGSGILVALEDFYMMSQMGSALITAASPRHQLTAFTFTGTATGASISARPARSSASAQVAKLVSASTGLTITRTQDIKAFLPYASQSGSSGGPVDPQDTWWNPVEVAQIVLSPGEGLGFFQADAGSNSDTRRVNCDIAWTEFTEP